jgi:hypothetical protein
MESTLGLIGAITGVAGLLVSVLVVRWQAKVQARSDRMTFLSNRIFDVSIPFGAKELQSIRFFVVGNI